MKNIILTIFITGFIISSCKKDKEEVARNIQINFTEPHLNDTIPSWNQVHIEGTITSEGTMKGYTIYVINEENQDVIYAKVYNTKAEAYNFHEHWMNNLHDTTDVLIKVSALKDNEGNNETKEIKVVCLP